VSSTASPRPLLAASIAPVSTANSARRATSGKSASTVVVQIASESQRIKAQASTAEIRVGQGIHPYSSRIRIGVVISTVHFMDSTTKKRSYEMTRSTSKGHAGNAPGFWERTRQLLHAFADAGQPSATGLQLLLGPNGGLMWTDAQVDRSEPYAEAVFSTPEKSAARIHAQSPAVVRPEEPAASPVATPLEVPVPN
jgi:hypothetical protein